MLDAQIRPEKLSNTALLFIIIAPIVVGNYLIFILNPHNADDLPIYVLQLIADFFSIAAVSGLWLTILLDTLTPVHQFIKPLKATKAEQQRLSVDVFIPVTNEPLEIVERTIKAAIEMDYPHNVCVLNDGSSEKVKEIAHNHGAFYIKRKNNLHAKSGNINNALKKSRSRFFAILDADFIASKHFLTTLLPYMEDDKVAFVQSPQAYMNTNNFIADGTATAQEIFYKYVLPAKNSSNSAFCVGTNMLFRREAIDDIGGIFALDHSEDIWTSLSLHEKGWKSIFVNTVLAIGLAPDDVISYFKQQKRWSQGGFSIFFKNNPLLSKDLSPDQKVQYLYTCSFYFVGFSILIYLILPILYLMFGLSPIRVVNSADWIIHYIPYFLVLYTLPIFLLGKIKLTTLSTSLATFYPYLQGLFSTIFSQQQTWVSTSSTRGKAAVPTLLYIWPHILIISLSVVGCLIGWYNTTDPTNTAINSFWALANAYLLGLFLVNGFTSQDYSQVIPDQTEIDLQSEL